MTTRQDRDTGNFLSNGPGVTLTPGQRMLAEGRHAAWAAMNIMRRINSGDKWFRVTDIFSGNPTPQGAFFAELIEYGVISRSNSKHPHPYYVPNGITVAWCNTAAALFDEKEAKK